MPFEKGRDKQGGRQAGTPNKFTSLKQTFLNAFANNGGEEWLTEWGADNPGPFFAILKGLLPKQIEAKIDASLSVVLVDSYGKEQEISGPGGDVTIEVGPEVKQVVNG